RRLAVAVAEQRGHLDAFQIPVRALSTTAATSVFTHEHVLGESKAEKERKARRALARSRMDESVTAGGLVEQTLKEMDEEAKSASKSNPPLTAEERKNRRRSLEGLPSFDSFLSKPLVRKPTAIFQINIGLYCNQACSHCHVESSPRRLKEQMDKKT